MVIHGPETADYDIDIGPVMLSDWYHSDYFTLVNNTMHGAVPVSNNNLVRELDQSPPSTDIELALTLNATLDQWQDELSLREHHPCMHTKRWHQQVQIPVRQEVPPQIDQHIVRRHTEVHH
jgi:hypothetical protein